MRPVLLGFCLFASACGASEQKIEGSLSELLALDYQEVESVQTADELSLRFFRGRGAAQDTVFKLSVKIGDIGVQPSVPIDLAQDYEGRSRGSVTREVLDDPRHDFPEVERGTLRLSALLSPGAAVDGEFSVTFENGAHFAAGRTAFETFRTVTK